MITNPSAKRVLCFGDSLTWGYEPGSKHLRYASNIRWTGKLQSLLGDGYEIIEEGLNSRDIKNGDPRPGKEGRRALDYIIPCLDTHDPIDYMIVLLGTNELKYENHLEPAQIASNLKDLLTIIQNRPSQFRQEKPQLILLAPPYVNEDTEYCRAGDKYKGAHAKSIELAKYYENLAADTGAGFLDLGKVVIPGVDGIHIDANAHAKVAKSIAQLLRG